MYVYNTSIYIYIFKALRLFTYAIFYIHFSETTMWIPWVRVYLLQVMVRVAPVIPSKSPENQWRFIASGNGSHSYQKWP